ncbi:MAG: xylulokinase, partial [Lachnospiraceae bacterium]|nr:xylulokinase [Lachnospiraceae bacterium]
EDFSKIKKIMLPKDYLVYKLTGSFVTDYSDAAGMLLLDVEHKCWSKEMCDICSISEDLLPKLHESYDIVGEIKKEYLDEIGLKTNVKVVAGAGDNAGSAIGTGTIADGRCNISIGTSGTVFISTDSYKKVSNNAIHNFCHSNGKYHLMGCILSAASANKWFISDILGTKEYDKERSAITLDDLGNNKVYFLPYLMGDRTPINDVNARGVFLGMSMDTKRSHMVEAVLEGVSYALRDSLELAKEAGIKITKATLVGGGAVSEIWQHIICDIMNIDIEILESNEGPSLGAAILAAYADGVFKNLEDAANAINKVIKVVKPDKARAEKYEVCYKKYKSI